MARKGYFSLFQREIHFEDALCTLFYVIRLMKGIVEGLVVNREKIEENLRKYGDFYYSQALLLALVKKGLPRKDAYEIVKRVSHKSFDEGVSLREMVLSDAELGKIFTPQEIDEIFKTDFLRNVDEVYRRFGLS
jgi:Adenylosuccinate lyase